MAAGADGEVMLGGSREGGARRRRCRRNCQGKGESIVCLIELNLVLTARPRDLQALRIQNNVRLPHGCIWRDNRKRQRQR